MWICRISEMKISGRWGNFFYHNWSWCSRTPHSWKSFRFIDYRLGGHQIVSLLPKRRPADPSHTCTTSHLLAASSLIFHSHPSPQTPKPHLHIYIYYIYIYIYMPFSHLSPPTSPNRTSKIFPPDLLQGLFHIIFSYSIHHQMKSHMAWGKKKRWTNPCHGFLTKSWDTNRGHLGWGDGWLMVGEVGKMEVYRPTSVEVVHDL